MSQPLVALITGGAKRVGRAVAERLSDAGYEIFFTYRSSESEARALQATLTKPGQRAVACSADLTRPAEAADAIAGEFSRHFDRLDVLVNNASLYEPSALMQTDLTQSRRLMAIHYESPLLLAQKFAPLLRASHGHIVNMIDLLAERPWPQYLAYCASKAALMNLTLSLARELAPEVTVNGIAPGIVEWPDNYPDSEKQKYLARVPLQRPGTPADVASLVHFLATAGNYITGQIIHLDGGRSIS